MVSEATPSLPSALTMLQAGDGRACAIPPHSSWPRRIQPWYVCNNATTDIMAGVRRVRSVRTTRSPMHHSGPPLGTNAFGADAAYIQMQQTVSLPRRGAVQVRHLSFPWRRPSCARARLALSGIGIGIRSVVYLMERPKASGQRRWRLAEWLAGLADCGRVWDDRVRKEWREGMCFSRSGCLVCLGRSILGVLSCAFLAVSVQFTQPRASEGVQVGRVGVG